MQSRYYNTQWGSFINIVVIARSIGELLGHNLFTHYKNNPVNNFDPDGLRTLRSDFNETDYVGTNADYGAAPDYIPASGDGANCYTYATQLNRIQNSGNREDEYANVEAEAALIVGDVTSDLNAREELSIQLMDLILQ